MAPVIQSSQQWVEKYRPKQVKDVAHQDEVVRVLTNTLETGSCPHMLFYGPPAVLERILTMDDLVRIDNFLHIEPELYKSRVLELNASDDRGINVVRTKIKNFAAVAVGSGRQGGYPCPPFKIIILDEADSMTEDAQASLMLCGVPWKLTPESQDSFSFVITSAGAFSDAFFQIIEPLASRCAKFRFKPLSEDIMTGRVLHICKEEGLDLDSEALSTLSSISQGDLRRAITYLQGAARLFGSSISSKDLISVSGVIPQEVVQSLFAACKGGDFDVVNKEVNNVILEGYPVSQMLSQLFEVIVGADDISDEQKAKICKKLAETDKCLVDGADEYLQLLDVASITTRVLCNMPLELSYEN
ncbi:hypothetical protein RHGRI_017543 [Rhododendron griersonianum]|uniref:Replication factor C C-terminal domain-containing protein n=1 Tax=Rhododendron griersonianum TaxID=479676 RepID=A0AAV6JY62_9ERIC|nr:hypothetical protein RHGRI_017543 [Rhododendron griersonianum]